MQQTSDGGSIIAGETHSFGSGLCDFWLVKTDAGGNVQWNKTYGGADPDDAFSVQETRDGGYIVAGSTGSFGAGGRDSWLIKLAAEDNTPPEIGTPSREPSGDVMPDQPVKVSANVTDLQSGVKNVTLSYTTDNGTSWTNLPMTNNITSGLYQTTIPGKPPCTWVKYKIIAYDKAENPATKDGTEPHYVYHVIPEFPPAIILPLFMILSIIVVIFAKRRLPRKPKN